MKTNLLLRIKATVCALFLFLMHTALSAQTINRHYAINEEHYASSGVCIPSIIFPGDSDKCAEIINPLNAIGNNENDYSILKTNSRITPDFAKQTLIFTNVNVDNNTNRVVIGIGTDNGTPLSADILKDLQLSTGAPLSYSGINSNTIAYQYPLNTLLKLGGPDPTKGEIEIPCTSTNPCDRIQIIKSGLFISIPDKLSGYRPLNGLRIYYAYQYQNYQNPSSNLSTYNQNGLFTLDKNIASEGSEVSLINTSGKEVFRSRINANTFEAKLPEGMYILKLQTKENKIYTSKVIVK